MSSSRRASTSRSARTSPCCASPTGTRSRPGASTRAATTARSSAITERRQSADRPFYVEGAKPGDTLAVRLDRLRPNRERGFTGTLVAPNVVDPWFAPELPYDSAPDVDYWTLDLERGTARLESPPAGLESLPELPLEPMLGCFGVAPAERPGDLVRDLGPARREHGLPRLPRGRHGLLPGIRRGRAAARRRRPRAPGRRRDRRHRDRGLLRRRAHRARARRGRRSAGRAPRTRRSSWRSGTPGRSTRRSSTRRPS